MILFKHMSCNLSPYSVLLSASFRSSGFHLVPHLKLIKYCFLLMIIRTGKTLLSCIRFEITDKFKNSCHVYGHHYQLDAICFTEPHDA